MMETPDRTGTTWSTSLNSNSYAGAAARTPRPVLPRGSSIGRYVTLEQLGVGGMGVVYKAYDPQLDRIVAVKLVGCRRADTAADDRLRARLLREAQALARLAHPNVVGVYDVGLVGDDLFVAMELVEGDTLRDWLRQASPNREQVLQVMLAAGRGLGAAHQAGLVHRDFKPENVIVGKDGRVRVIDFGLARPGQVQRRPSARRLDASEGQRKPTDAATGNDAVCDPTSACTSPAAVLEAALTQPGGRVGTPAYMAPEQRMGRSVDARADQFSFCVVLYEALCGRRPRAGDPGDPGDPTPATATRGRRRTSSHEVKLPPRLNNALARGLSREPQHRFRCMSELLDTLTYDPEAAARARRTQQGRTALLVGLLAAAVGAPLAVRYKLELDRHRICEKGPEHLGSVWDRAVKRRGRQAFVQTDLPYAADAWQGVERILDQYAFTWVSEFKQACLATKVRQVQSEEVLARRMACLSQRLEEVRALTDLFARADTVVVEKAVLASTALPKLDACAKEGLPASDPEPTTTHGNAMARALAKVKALQRTGKYRQALEQARTLVKQGDASRSGPRRVEALRQLGSLLSDAGEIEAAKKTLNTALRMAGDSRDAMLVAATMLDLAELVGAGQAPSEAEAGLLLADSAGALLKTTGEDPSLLGRLHSVTGTLCRSRGEFDRALDQYTQAFELFKGALGPDHPRVADSLSNLGIAWSAKGKYARALAAYSQALAVLERKLGPNHPQVASILNNLANAETALAEYALAAQHFTRAQGIQEEAFGSQHPSVAVSLRGLATVASAKGEHIEALQYADRALEVATKVFGRHHRLVAGYLEGMGIALSAKREFAKALRYQRRALEIRKEALGSDHPSVASSLNNLGAVLVATGECKRALTHVHRALTINEKVLPDGHVELGVSLCHLGDALRCTRNFKDAWRAHRRAVSIFEKALGSTHPRVAWALSGLAHAETALGETQQARQGFERAVQICAKAPCQPGPLAQSQFWLARLIVEMGGERERARDLALRARWGFARANLSEELAATQAWLSQFAR